MLIRKLGKLGLILVIVGTPLLSAASTNSMPLGVATSRNFLDARQQQWNPAIHNSQFAGIPASTIASTCESVQPPQALATPDPLLDEPGSTPQVTVSFIVGIDGRVHDPLVLQSSGPEQDNVVLKVVGSWRYRPATCNGVATETEGKIAFSVR